ncbi:MC024.1 [Molluscum contagiosum virus subtype 2]|uniref:MC024.1 n=2 Tax=Molluscum contagiosum virus TaxID=10279 RepID=A0A1S7DM61_MCV2|nr:MC024.1 [Molluscum contagiosum virus subtype 2]QHW16409.1 MC024.1R [Molluscum contagiosum virus]AYO87659.1 MC024.1 [Molluscum contagiosum virus subtype 2]AYO87829.1 MC024.1 [Molluscum contagiosum virus subtype 2]AYO87999.1 MC024.1 [Molluscum contagiosum virus subtype 2]
MPGAGAALPSTPRASRADTTRVVEQRNDAATARAHAVRTTAATVAWPQQGPSRSYQRLSAFKHRDVRARLVRTRAGAFPALPRGSRGPSLSCAATRSRRPRPSSP